MTIERPPGSRVPRRGFNDPEVRRKATAKGNATKKALALEKKKLAELERKADKAAGVELKRIMGEKNLRQLDKLGDDSTIPAKQRAEIKMFLVEHSLGKATQKTEATGSQTIQVVLSQKMMEAKSARELPASTN